MIHVSRAAGSEARVEGLKGSGLLPLAPSAATSSGKPCARPKSKFRNGQEAQQGF